MANAVALKVAQECLGELLERVERGEEIVIEREGRMGMRIVPASATDEMSERRVGGQNLLGIRYISPDFDAPMTEHDLRDWEQNTLGRIAPSNLSS